MCCDAGKTGDVITQDVYIYASVGPYNFLLEYIFGGEILLEKT